MNMPNCKMPELPRLGDFNQYLEPFNPTYSPDIVQIKAMQNAFLVDRRSGIDIDALMNMKAGSIIFTDKLDCIRQVFSEKLP